MVSKAPREESQQAFILLLELTSDRAQDVFERQERRLGHRAVDPTRREPHFDGRIDSVAEIRHVGISKRGKGSSINDVTQFSITFDTPSPHRHAF